MDARKLDDILTQNLVSNLVCWDFVQDIRDMYCHIARYEMINVREEEEGVRFKADDNSISMNPKLNEILEFVHRPIPSVQSKTDQPNFLVRDFFLIFFLKNSMRNYFGHQRLQFFVFNIV
jgi:hypothetical protein